MIFFKMAICYIGLGTNLGKRKKNIQLAIKKIKSLPQTKVLKAAKIRASHPQGGPKRQPEFLNTVIKIKTALGATCLFKKLKKIEKELGRKKTVRFGPRPIDLDILLYGDKIIKRKDLVIPHPRIFKRPFVLKPLLEIL